MSFAPILRTLGFVVAAREVGQDEHDIEKLALAHFGDPVGIDHSFAWVYRHER